MTTETTALRSRIMRAVKSQNTSPELLVRKLLYAQGYRFRLHRKDIPGSPDVAFISRKKAIFVHGCFWHGHDCKRGARAPKSNAGYWTEKIARNRARDARTVTELRRLGWRRLTLWECELKDIKTVRARLERFLGSP
jgi:DNA mismatch endonuclease (patch repair protein)